MKNQINKIKECLDKNIEMVTSKESKSKSNNDFIKNRKRLFRLLADHPYFERKITELRLKYKLPTTGITEPSEAYLWEHKSRKRYHEYVKDIDTLVSDFEISNVYRRSVWQFVYDYVLVPTRKSENSIAQYPIFSIVKTDEDREVNKFLVESNGLYIQVFDWTTKRDIEKAMKKITAIKKEKLPFKVSKVEELARDVWAFSREGLNDKEIAKKLTKKNKVFTYQDVPVYRKRYKKALNTLRALDL